MSAKEYLMQYRLIQAKLKNTEAMIKQIRAELEGLKVELTGYWPDGQPHGTGMTDPTGNLAVVEASFRSPRKDELRKQLADLEVQEYRERSDLWHQRALIEDTIGAVKNLVYYEILHRTYIEGQSFEFIAVDMGYSYRHTTRLHGEALLVVEKILKKSGK